MCGIAGSTQSQASVLATMRERLAHRGPDDAAIWQEQEGGIGFAHTRLAVIDLSRNAAQPMHSACGRYVLAYNGEIYNFKELRGELEAAGERFRSASDTEVLLALLSRDGTQALARVVGMFAFALWDRAERTLVLARDRLGVKPLVYAPLASGHLAFASEIEALKAHPGVDLGRDAGALSAYLACLYVPAPLTIHRGVRKLPPGHLLTWREGRSEISPYWSPSFTGGRPIDADEAAEELMPLVRSAVSLRMIADVPVGCFLSGGIDSSLCAALMAEEAKRQGAPPIKTFTMTFAEAAYDERAAAARVARHIGAEHTELAASPRLASHLGATLRAFGEPFGNPTSLLVEDLSRLARAHVTVALTGDGGDELFAGYPRYAGGLMARRYRRLPAWLRTGLLAPAARFIPESTRGRHAFRRAREFLSQADRPDAEMYAAWVEYFSPAERRALLGLDATPPSPIAALYGGTPSSHPLDAMQRTDLLSFLPGNLLAYGDAMSMRHSLELRLPLTDHRLVEALGRLAPETRLAGGLKGLLKRMAARLLPPDIVRRRKVGFNPPLGRWLARDLGPMVGARLRPETMRACGLDWAPVKRLLDEHAGGGRDHALKVWALLALDAWQSGQ